MPKCDFDRVARNLIEIALRHGCSPVNLLHIFRTPFPKNTTGVLLLHNIVEVGNIVKCCGGKLGQKTSKGIYMFCLKLHRFFRTHADDQF